MNRAWKAAQQQVAAYFKRNEGREISKLTATMELVLYYITLGDDQPTAEDKVSQISHELRSPNKSDLDWALNGWRDGCPLCKADLFAGIDAVSEVTYPFFDVTAKTLLKDKLNGL